jgi:hypothetical protein
MLEREMRMGQRYGDEALLGIARLTGLVVKLTAGLALQMKTNGGLPSAHAAEFSAILRELAHLYEDGDLQTASELWTAAKLLEKPSGFCCE